MYYNIIKYCCIKIRLSNYAKYSFYGWRVLKDALIFTLLPFSTFVIILRDYYFTSYFQSAIRAQAICTYVFLLFSSHYKLCYIIFSLILPTSVPVYFWNEDPVVALFCCFFCRTVIQLNGTWLVNSAAHLYGTRPFDK